MHLMIPFASALSESAIHALRDLSLPRLERYLGTASEAATLGTDEYSLTPPHERALAEAFGWHAADGSLPWAAHAAALDGIETGDAAWGLLTPAHWHVGREQVSLADPRELHLSPQESRQFLDAIGDLFESEGWTLAFGAADRWYAAHDSLDGLACASLDRVIGRNVDLWLAGHPQARLVRRLQNEVQMLLYTHPLNDAREARGELPVNSFWLSGCGRAQPMPASAEVRIADDLREPALAGDWAAWAEAWHRVDEGPVADLLRAAPAEAATLTLSGERHARRFQPVARSAWQRLTRAWRGGEPHAILESL